MTQWAEIRHLHLVDGMAKKEIARRFRLNVKTVRRAILTDRWPRKRPGLGGGACLEPLRAEVEALLRAEPRISAKRIGRVLEGELKGVSSRTVRSFVARVRRQVSPSECFVHRTHKPGETMEVDFGEGWALISGIPKRVKFLVATLPASRVHFAKAYPVERTECLLDGIQSAFEYFGGVTTRVVLDNTSLAVKKVLAGPDRIETQMFHAFRGAFPFHADFCAPAKGNEKGSVEGGVKYVRDNSFMPRPEVKGFEELNQLILNELDHDLDLRKLPDGRTAREAWRDERTLLRILPKHKVDTCRVETAVADKYAHIRVDRNAYSIPSKYTRMDVTVKLFHDVVAIGCQGIEIARHKRCFDRYKLELAPEHILPVLARKHRAAPESTAIQNWRLPLVFEEFRQKLSKATRKGNQEWVHTLMLIESFDLDRVQAAVQEAMDRHSPRLATIQMILRQADGHPPKITPLTLNCDTLAQFQVAAPVLSAWDSLLEVR